VTQFLLSSKKSYPALSKDRADFIVGNVTKVTKVKCLSAKEINLPDGGAFTPEMKRDVSGIIDRSIQISL
jgi:hypothetical protein